MDARAPSHCPEDSFLYLPALVTWNQPCGEVGTRVPARLQAGGGPSEVYTYLPLPAPLGRYVLKAMENYLSPTHPPNFYLSTTVKVSSLLFKSLSVANTQLKLAFLRHENFLAYVTWKFKEVMLTSSPSGAHVHPLKQSLWLWQTHKISFVGLGSQTFPWSKG